MSHDPAPANDTHLNPECVAGKHRNCHDDAWCLSLDIPTSCECECHDTKEKPVDPIEFEAWPKIARLNRGMTITEKIDGTNAAVIITDDGRVGAQSRSRLITPDADNFGFAAWVTQNAETLVTDLGPGRHFGEWWGSGIQRGYGLQKGEKRFSLFNSYRWGNPVVPAFQTPGLYVVPVIYIGPFSTETVEGAVDLLRVLGSQASPGFMNPEGVVVWHDAARQMFKVTLEGDDAPKSLQ